MGSSSTSVAANRQQLAGILLDTGNLRNPHSTSKDNYMATLLINGAGRFGCNGLYQMLRYKMYDVSELKVGEILRKDLKKWTKIDLRDEMKGFAIDGVTSRKTIERLLEEYIEISK